MTAHWADDPTNDFAFNAYALGWDSALSDHRRGVRHLPDYHSQPYKDGYHDGWLIASERNTP